MTEEKYMWDAGDVVVLKSKTSVKREKPKAQEAGMSEQHPGPTPREQPELHESHTGDKVSAQCPLCSFPESILYPDHAGLLVCSGCGKTWDPDVEGRRL